MKEYKDNCLVGQHLTEDCSAKVMKKAKINKSRIDNCVINSF